MKKGLLGVVVAALTVVGCQNYDDQFDDLNQKIASLTTTVTDLSSVQTNVALLSDKLDAVANSALSDADLAGILAEVSSVQAEVAAVKTEIAALENTDVSTIESDLDVLETDVEEIKNKLDDLLASNAVINQSITISSLAELSLAEDLIPTDEGDPTVTINGTLTVDNTGSSDITDASDVARLNAVLGKIKVVMGAVDIDTPSALDAAALQYVGDTFSITGDVSAGALATVTGAVTISSNDNILMPTLTSTGGVTINTAGVTITTVDLSGLTQGDVITGASELSLLNATSVKVGGVLPTLVNAPLAETFMATGSADQTNTSITVDGSEAFSLATTAFTEPVSITATGDVHLPQVAAAGQLSIDTEGAVDLSGLTSIADALSVSATTVDLSAVASVDMASIVTATSVVLTSLASIDEASPLTLDGPDTVSVPALTALGGNIIAASATTFAAEALATSTGTIDIADGATVHLKDLGATTDLVDFATIATLKLFEQDTDIDFSTAAALVTLDYTGKAAATATEGAQNNTLTVSSGNASLTTLTIGAGGLGTLTVSGTSLASLETNGVIINTLVSGNAALASFDFGHTHVDGDFATTVSIVDNDALVSVDLSDLSKVKHVNITGNASLTTITAPSASSLAEPVTTVTVTIADNDVTGTYTAAVSGTQTTAYQAATLTGESITGFKTFIDAYVAATNTVSFSIEIDSEQSAIAGDSAAIAGGQLSDSNGLIDTALELTLMTD